MTLVLYQSMDGLWSTWLVPGVIWVLYNNPSENYRLLINTPLPYATADEKYLTCPEWYYRLGKGRGCVLHTWETRGEEGIIDTNDDVHMASYCKENKAASWPW